MNITRTTRQDKQELERSHLSADGAEKALPAEFALFHNTRDGQLYSKEEQNWLTSWVSNLPGGPFNEYVLNFHPAGTRGAPSILSAITFYAEGHKKIGAVAAQTIYQRDDRGQFLPFRKFPNSTSGRGASKPAAPESPTCPECHLDHPGAC
jgi:hypothetical protein